MASNQSIVYLCKGLTSNVEYNILDRFLITEAR